MLELFAERSAAGSWQRRSGGSSSSSSSSVRARRLHQLHNAIMSCRVIDDVSTQTDDVTADALADDGVQVSHARTVVRECCKGDRKSMGEGEI